MAKDATDIMDARELVTEISRLRAEVARLEGRVAQLDELAHQDSLVGLPNRRGFMRDLNQAIARSGRYGGGGAMLYVDVDGLKLINDSFGHRAGDEALIQIARLLTQGLRRSDVVARIGGDEFGILLEKVDEPRAKETAARLSESICSTEVIHDGDVLPLGVAIGVAMIGRDDSAEDVMARADAEMYRRKAAA